MKKITYFLLLLISGTLLIISIIVTNPRTFPNLLYWSYISVLSFIGWVSIFDDKIKTQLEDVKNGN